MSKFLKNNEEIELALMMPPSTSDFSDSSSDEFELHESLVENLITDIDSSIIRNSLRLSKTPPSSTSFCISKLKRKQLIQKYKKKEKKGRLSHHWERVDYFHTVDIPISEYSKRQSILSHLEYFKLFFDDDFMSSIVYQTNLYSVQKTGKSVNMTLQELWRFIGIHMIMGIVKMPSYKDYWAQWSRYSVVADVMPRKRYDQLISSFHFNNNEDDVGTDRYYKIRPVLDKLRQNFLKIDEEGKYSIDEMMVPYKGTHAGSRRQYMKCKPTKWGIKIFVRSGISGLVYDFLPYGGESTFDNVNFTKTEETFGLGEKIVLALSKSIQTSVSFVYFDNFFTSLRLVQYLRMEMGILSLGTIRANRLRNCTLLSDKELLKKGRGSHDQMVDNNSKLCVVKWADNKCVTLVSSYVDGSTTSNVQRYSRIDKKKIDVPCPEIVKEYNKHMGGVDLSDMLVSLYRTRLRTRRWYMTMYSQLLDVAINNAWLLYRRDYDNIYGDKKHCSLKEFRFLLFEKITQSKCGRPTKDNNIKTIKKPSVKRPSDAIRLDQDGHFPTYTTKNQCKNCTTGQTKVGCIKCNVNLCFTPDRNCFNSFHTK